MRFLAMASAVASSILLALTAEGGGPGDGKALEGTWRGWVVEGTGTQPDRGPVHLEIVIRGDRITAKRLDDKNAPDLGEGTFQLGTAGKLKTLDATRASKPGKGQKHAGIWELEGDTLRWCTSPPNGERPAEFLTKRGQFLMVLKRHKQ